MTTLSAESSFRLHVEEKVPGYSLSSEHAVLKSIRGLRTNVIMMRIAMLRAWIGFRLNQKWET